ARTATGDRRKSMALLAAAKEAPPSEMGSSLGKDFDTELLVELHDLRGAEACDVPGGRRMAGLGVVAVPEHAFHTGRREHEQQPGAVEARVFEAVPNASGNEHEVAGAG